MKEAEKILFKAAFDNIIFLKRQQWTITNYLLLTYAAVFALTRGGTDGEKGFLTALIFVTLAYGLYCVWHTQTSMVRYYNHVFDMREKYLTEKERQIYSWIKQRPDFHYNRSFFVGLLATNVTAFAITLYLMWWRPDFSLLNAVTPKCA